VDPFEIQAGLTVPGEMLLCEHGEEEEEKKSKRAKKPRKAKTEDANQVAYRILKQSTS
jgi:hypothetical protein